MFYRRSQEAGLSGVSILWNIEGVHAYGIDHFKTAYLVDDILHTGALGVYGKYVSKALTILLVDNCFKVGLNLTKRDRMERGVLVLRQRLKRHYRNMRLAKPTYKLSRVRHFTLGMLGSEANPDLHAKGGQTIDLLRFASSLMSSFAQQGPQYRYLATAGRAIVAYHDLLRSEPRRMSILAQQRLMDLCLQHLVAYRLGGGLYVPKHHASVHLSANAGWSGNPMSHSTFQDEDENGQTARAGRTSHPFAFPYTVLRKITARERLQL